MAIVPPDRLAVSLTDFYLFAYKTNALLLQALPLTDRRETA